RKADRVRDGDVAEELLHPAVAQLVDCAGSGVLRALPAHGADPEPTRGVDATIVRPVARLVRFERSDLAHRTGGELEPQERAGGCNRERILVDDGRSGDGAVEL